MKDTAKKVSYDDLFRYNEQYVGELVYFEAQVVQGIDEEKGHYHLRANVTKDEFNIWEDEVFLINSGGHLLSGGRLFLDGDIIEFVGRVSGRATYVAVSGRYITIPEIYNILSRRVP